MRIRMVTERTGTRWDGQPWPPRGGEIDVPDEEGAALCEHGDAVPVAQHAKAETPEDSLDAAETRGTVTSGAAEGTSTPAAAVPEPKSSAKKPA